MKLNKSEGFTLVEIMIVVAIIALLASIAVPSFMRARQRSQCTKMLQEMRLIDAAVDQYAIEEEASPGGIVGGGADTLVKYIKGNSSLASRMAGADKSVVGAVKSCKYSIPNIDGTIKVTGVTNFASVLGDPDQFWAPFSHD